MLPENPCPRSSFSIGIPPGPVPVTVYSRTEPIRKMRIGAPKFVIANLIAIAPPPHLQRAVQAWRLAPDFSQLDRTCNRPVLPLLYAHLPIAWLLPQGPKRLQWPLLFAVRQSYQYPMLACGRVRMPLGFGPRVWLRTCADPRTRAASRWVGVRRSRRPSGSAQRRCSP